MEPFRKICLYWGYIDITHTGDKKETYFGRFAEESNRKNLKLIRNCSVVMMLTSLFVILITQTFFTYAAPLQKVYFPTFLMHLFLFFFTGSLLKRETLPRSCIWIARMYLVYILGFGTFIGTRFSQNESAAIFLVVLIVSQMVFAIPPAFTVPLGMLATVATLCISYVIKDDRFFRADVMNCTGVLILAVLVGWIINRMRVEEAFARARVVELNAQLKHMSVTDQLTGLENHRCFHDTYDVHFSEALLKKRQIGIIMMDVDKFKDYNDHYGHLAGDDCLAAIGRAFASLQTEEILAYRFGGEEFIILLTGSACETSSQVAEDFCSAVQKLQIPHAYARAADIVTVSAGVYTAVPQSMQEQSHFISQADHALYESKARGGNTITTA